MSFIADTHNNPFHIDDATLPPQRSALAVLEVEGAELRELGVDAAYERARRRLGSDSGLAMVYGRSLHEDDLRIAATRLENPRDRVVNELLDFRHEAFQLGDVEELAEILDGFRAALSSEIAPRLEDPSLIARILASRVEIPEIARLAPLSCSRPDLPALDQLLADEI